MDLLTAGQDGARWMQVLNETGFLGRYIPDWARIVGQMQFDSYHVFTVDEHTIEAVRVLDTLDRGDLTDVAPIASGLMEDLQSRRALYVAALLHDMAKGRGGDHSELGAELALTIGPHARPVGGGDGDGVLAGAAAPAAEPDRVPSATSTTRRPSWTWWRPSSRRSGSSCCWC